jgi:hypothetical protein
VPPKEETVGVWEEWRKRQKRPNACQLGEATARLIRRALKEASSDDVRLLIRYAYEADEAGPRFWRGANDHKRTYLGLDNLLVQKKLQRRIQLALDWEETQISQNTSVDGTSFGPMAPYRSSTPRGTQSSPDPRPKRLSVQCRKMLELFLERGDSGVCTRELAAIGLKYTCRISELRGAGAEISLQERCSDGNNLYVMLNHEGWV